LTLTVAAVALQSKHRLSRAFIADAAAQAAARSERNHSLNSCTGFARILRQSGMWARNSSLPLRVIADVMPPPPEEHADFLYEVVDSSHPRFCYGRIHPKFRRDARSSAALR
jgi:hypothetical protein